MRLHDGTVHQLLILCQKDPVTIYLRCRQTEHFPCIFGVEIPVNLGFVLKISRRWFHPSVVIIFADYAPYDNCICLWISHHMQMLIWPITFLSPLYYGLCLKPGASQLQPCMCATQQDVLRRRGAAAAAVVPPLELGDGWVGHAARHVWQPVFVHAELELCKQWLNFPIDICMESNLSASNLMYKCLWVLLAFFFFLHQTTSSAFSSRRQLHLLSMTWRTEYVL